MPTDDKLLSDSACRKLKRIVRKHQSNAVVPAMGNWRKKSDSELWAYIVVQVSVVGNSNLPGLGETISSYGDWYLRLARQRKDKSLREIHALLRDHGVRYCSKDRSECRKSSALAKNLSLLKDRGGPRNYMSELAKLKGDYNRARRVSDDMSYIKNKGSRDLLINLGLIRQGVALDARIINILRDCGVYLPARDLGNRKFYDTVEAEILERVCGPLGINGSKFDRTLFQNYDVI